MNLTLPNKILLLTLYGLPVNVLFAQPSLVEGYVTTPCVECDSPIATRDNEPIPEICPRSSCLKYDRFPMACLAMSLRDGEFKTIRHDDTLSLILDKTLTLRCILPADAETGFWIPRRPADRKRFNLERMWRSRRHRTLRPPVWRGNKRPNGVRRVKAHSNFPSHIFVRRLLDDLAYPPEASSAFFTRAHAPWMNPKPDRRKKTCPNIDGFGQDDDTTLWQPHDYVTLVNPAHPYNPASPSRRTQTGGGYTEAQVQKGLQKMRTDSTTKAALLEIVHRRRGTLQVAEKFGLPAQSLYVQASRLRQHIKACRAENLHVGKKAA